jgi:hypothetical protein
VNGDTARTNSDHAQTLRSIRRIGMQEQRRELPRNRRSYARLFHWKTRPLRRPREMKRPFCRHKSY